MRPLPPHDVPAFPFAVRRATIPRLHSFRMPKKAHPMTEELFRSDSYLRECEAVVTAVRADGLMLDRTVFYPQGGGQPGDIGSIDAHASGILQVIDTIKENDDIVHVIKGDISTDIVGQAVQHRLGPSASTHAHAYLYAPIVCCRDRWCDRWIDSRWKCSA